MTRARTNADQARTESLSVAPHIILNVLYPAVAGKLLDGTTDHGSTYGVAQGDGRSYYYTDIKGSKPIKDPRIGSHFGSQRHKFKSIQLLEQETATHGSNVYSIDGREWCRAVGAVSLEYSDHTSSRVNLDATGAFFEITGYFNNANFLLYAGPNSNSSVVLNGGSAKSNTEATGSVASPLGGRYVDNSSLTKLVFNTTPVLGINTIKIIDVSSHIIYATGIELIAQDVSSTANKSKIQIPSQNVVSFGKKFTVGGSSAHTHYDPFNGFTNSSGNAAGLHSTYVDTATSLGLSTGTLYGATWAISGSNNIRPLNGGRVVKWVDSTGAIKTSVTMMPPNAQNITTTAAAEITTPSATNTAYLPAFSDDAVDYSLSEVAKTFINEEFGNGSANKGYIETGSNDPYADASMLNALADDIAYVMDDGLTSLSANGVTKGTNAATGGYINTGNGEAVYTTFIGTGITLGITNWNGDGKFRENVAFNLPYGTHILKVSHEGSNVVKYLIDGVEVKSVAATVWGPIDFTFYQPKMPPIPEDAVIISDYMLMADFVPTTTATLPNISKGVRWQSSTRDIVYNASSGSLVYNQGYPTRHIGSTVIYFNMNGYTLSEAEFTAFGDAFSCYYDRDTDRSTTSKVFLDGDLFSYNSNNVYASGTAISASSVIDKSGSPRADVYGIKNQTLGMHTFGDKMVGDPGATKFNTWAGFEVASPIHTSSHYQTFETPFLHELVGGDRNMEQTNLVVTPDGKTWDQVTRDVSYIGSGSLVLDASHGDINIEDVVVFDDCRGFNISGNGVNCYNKDFALANDRVVCLKDGQYKIAQSSRYRNTQSQLGGYVKVNGVIVIRHISESNSWATCGQTAIVELKRGDYVQVFGGDWYSNSWSTYSIERLS